MENVNVENGIQETEVTLMMLEPMKWHEFRLSHQFFPSDDKGFFHKMLRFIGD